MPREFWYKLSNFFTVDSGGWRALFGATMRAALLGAAVSVGRSITHGADGHVGFDWRLFGITVGAVALVNLFSNVVDVATRGGNLLRPVHGRVFRAERKVKSAAVLSRISFLLDESAPDPGDVARAVTDILDCIALHVRDARGSHDKNRVDVFVSLLIEDGEDLVVVARDSGLHSTEYKRDIPVRYRKGTMLAMRAMLAGRALSVGDFCKEYPEGPKHKPYASILAVPIIGSDEKVLAVVSVDSTRPYFFQSFQAGAVEHELENGLLPYLQTLLLALERLAGTTPAGILQNLTSIPTIRERGP